MGSNGLNLDQHPGYPLQGFGSDPTNLSTVLTTTLACAYVDRITSHPEMTRAAVPSIRSPAQHPPLYMSRFQNDLAARVTLFELSIGLAYLG